MRQASISMRVSMFSRRPRRRKDGFGRSCRVLGAEACLGGVHKVGVLTLRAVDGVHRGEISPFKVESFVFCRYACLWKREISFTIYVL